MAEAERDNTDNPIPRKTLADYYAEKLAKLGDPQFTADQVRRELIEGKLRFEYLDADGQRHRDLPNGYALGDAHACIDVTRSSAVWLARTNIRTSFAFVLDPQSGERSPVFPEFELRIFAIEVWPPTAAAAGDAISKLALPAKSEPAKTVKSKNKSQRVDDIIEDFDQKRRFKDGMQPHEIESIVVPEYNKRWLRVTNKDKRGKYLAPSRDLISTRYKKYREARPLKKPPQPP